MVSPPVHTNTKLSSLPDSEKFRTNESKDTLKHANPNFSVISQTLQLEWTRPGVQCNTVYVKRFRFATFVVNGRCIIDDFEGKEYKPLRARIRLWASLNHVNIIPIIGFRLSGEPALVFAWYNNGNISQYSKAHPDADLHILLRDVGSGLFYLHSQPRPIIHGALQPSNVIIGDSGQAMLANFDTALDLIAVERQMELANLDPARSGYMSPEMIEEGTITMGADIFSFGSLMLEILSGRPPYYKLGVVQAMMRISEGSNPLPEDYPRIPYPSEVWEVMRQCWAFDPKKRPSIEGVNNMISRWPLEGPHS